jgi:hypothetical protein
MSDIKYVGPSLWPYKPIGAWKVKLDHSEIETIADTATPIATVSSLLPGGGPIVAATIGMLMWAIKRTDRKYGNRGVVVTSWKFNPVRSPDEWYGDH